MAELGTFDVGAGEVWMEVSFDVEVLDLSRLPIRQLPAELERCVRLRELHIWDSELETLGYVEDAEETRGVRLPASLRVLRAGSNRIAEVGWLPDGLLELNVQRNLLRALGPLPAGLQSLHVDQNQLEVLGPLPEGLLELDASSNRLHTPGTLPRGLRSASFSDNPLRDLNGLPDGLRELYISDCTELRDFGGLPVDLQELYSFGTPLADAHLLPRYLTSVVVDHHFPQEQMHVVRDINSGSRAVRKRRENVLGIAFSLLSCCPIVLQHAPHSVLHTAEQTHTAE